MMAVSRLFLQGAEDPSNTSTYTFSSQNIGTASADRYIVICAMTRAGGSTLAITGVTVQGITATLVVNAAANNSNSCAACIAIAAVPTGTTGDVVVTTNVTSLRCSISMYSIAGIDSATPSDTGSDQPASNTNDGPDITIDIPANGAVIMAVCGGNPAITYSWLDLTEDYDATNESFVASTGSNEFASLQTSYVSRTTGSSALLDQIGVAASWAPSAGGFQAAWARGSNVIIGV